MSEQTISTRDSQSQRWLKYGANVALTVIVVIALAVMVTYLAQRWGKRIDTTLAGAYSLKPQTVNLIKDNKQKIRLVSLYTNETADRKANPYAAPVNDLLEEYARKGSNIEFEHIDPITQPALADNLVGEAIKKYGGAVKAYQDFLDSFFAADFVKLRELTAAEASALANVQTDALGNDDRGQMLAALVDTIREQEPQILTRIKDRADRARQAKFPDYKAIVDRIKDDPEDSLTRLSQDETAIVKIAQQYKSDAAVPAPLKTYLADCAARHQAIQKLADDAGKKIDSLGVLKVGELQQAMKDQNLIVVLGDNDWRVINFEQVFVTDTRDLRGFAENQQIKPRFAGEQAVTTAILALTQNTKQKVAFVRAGGSPLTTPGFPPFQRGGPLSDVADRLRAYNFEILEKDLTGTWQMQAQMQGQPAPPEASDKDIENAIWIVIDSPVDPRMPPSNAMASKLADHLKKGGAAMVLALPQSDNLASALKDFGVDLMTDAVIVHQIPKTESPHAADEDTANEAQRLPFVFVLNKYGDHPLTRPVQSLDMLLIAAVPVKINSMAGVEATPLLPIPTFAPIWGERDLQSIDAGANFKFDAGVDVAPPLFAGAALEQKGEKTGPNHDGARLVVYGALQSFMNQMLDVPDTDMLRRGVFVARFPGNSELFVDSVFWLARMESMIEISPAAMDVPRIAKISDGSLLFWHLLALAGLPALVLAGGVFMYLSRRS